jgi:hypothetical protein
MEEKSIEQIKAEYEEMQRRLQQLEQPNSDKEKKKARKLFNKYDTNKSGSMNAHDLQLLAFDLGLPLNDEEAAKYVKELDTDGNGTLEFDEFYNWWTSADKKSGEDAKKLRLLKLKLQTRSLAASAKKLSAALGQGEKVERKDETTFNINVTMGDLETPRSSIQITHLQSEEEAKKAREAVNAEDGTVVISLRFTGKAGADEFAYGELSGQIKNIVSAIESQVPLAKVEANLQKMEGTKVFVVHLVLDPKKLPQLEPVIELLDAITLSEVSVRLELSEKPGDEPSENIAAKLSFKAGVDRGFVRAAQEELGQSESGKNALWLLATRNVEFDLALEDWATLQKLTGDLVPETKKYHQHVGFTSLKSKYVPALLPLLQDEEAGPLLLPLYTGLVELLSDVHSVQLVASNHVLTVSCTGFSLFEGYLPHPSEFSKYAPPKSVDEALERNLCTFAFTGKSYHSMYASHCNTCGLSGNYGICDSCAKICHAGHDVVERDHHESFFCDCGNEEKGPCKCLTPK